MVNMRIRTPLTAANGGTLRPGTLLECAGTRDAKGSTSGSVPTNSGIAVCKNESTKITIAYHGWEAVAKKTVYHPTQIAPPIGVIDHLVGEDIGLMTCNVPFSNDFPDLATTAKNLQTRRN